MTISVFIPMQMIQNCAFPPEAQSAVPELNRGLTYVVDWMTANFLTRNDEKTELALIF